ncbi:MAG: LCP family protein, partial [Rothia sp. (in: high G+C Gram-positive bacteria)]|nr:LCP family protein [Rothia sp. (in: high G+C Gram-positive bacteria)]
VDVCVTQPIDDSYSGLKLPAGNSSVQGEQALAFLRSRHGFGDGSDTSRISAQQSFLAPLLRKVKAEGTLSNPSQLMNIAEAITQNATVDQGLTNPANLAQVGSTLQGVDLNNIVFATVPHEPYTYDQNKLQLSPKAQDLFQRLKNDQSMIEPAPAESSASSTASSSASVSASEETVDKSALVSVLNGSGNSKRGDEVVSLLKKDHYSNAVESNAQTDYQASAIYYPAGSEALAQQLAQKLGITNVQESASYANVTLLVGQDFAEGDSIKQTDSKIAGQADGQTAEQVKCQQSFEY